MSHQHLAVRGIVNVEWIGRDKEASHRRSDDSQGIGDELPQRLKTNTALAVRLEASEVGLDPRVDSS
eukprot:3924433-Prymnesium_polylepis.1